MVVLEAQSMCDKLESKQFSGRSENVVFSVRSFFSCFAVMCKRLGPYCITDMLITCLCDIA